MILDLIFPKKCVGCTKPGGYICNACINKVKAASSSCPACQKPSIDGTTHYKCKTPLGLDGHTAIYTYEKVIARAIIGMKYQYASEIAKEIASFCVDRLNNHPKFIKKDFVLIPIPIHQKRENWRGFNQAEVMGKIISKEMGWKFIPNLLIRKKSTLPQTKLKGKERRVNVRGVFEINPVYCPPTTDYLPAQAGRLLTTDHRILLFDDVWTTGSTLKEACKVLKRNGFKKVWGLTIAK